MTKTTKTTKISAVFLAAVLIAGVIALSSPSFMTGAQAVPDFKNKFHKDGKDGFIKCNQWNININGVEFNINDLSFLEGLIGPEALEAEAVEANSFGNNDGNHGSDGGVAVICISNNDNRGAGVVDDEEPEVEDCEDCRLLLTEDMQILLDNALQENGIEIGDFEIKPPTTFAAVCEALEDLPTPLPIEVNDIIEFIEALIEEEQINDEDVESIIEFLLCLVDLGLIDIVFVPTPDLVTTPTT